MERSLGSPHTVCPPSWGSGRVQQPRGTNDPGCRGRERREGPRLPAAPRGSQAPSSFPRLTGAFHPTPAFLSHGHVPGFVFPAAEAPPSTRSAPETPHLPGERPQDAVALAPAPGRVGATGPGLRAPPPGGDVLACRPRSPRTRPGTRRPGTRRAPRAGACPASLAGAPAVLSHCQEGPEQRPGTGRARGDCPCGPRIRA